MKKIWQLYLIALERNKDIIVFPIVGAVMWFIQAIAIPSYDISWVLNINSWISSFIITLLTYMIFDLLLGKVQFFTNHKYIFATISFLTSTFIGETLTYSLKEELTWKNWAFASMDFIIGFIILLFACILGLSMGFDKARKNLKKIEQNHKRIISELSNKDKEMIISYCNKALAVDENVFELIACMKSKEAIKEIKKDLLDASNEANSKI